MRSKRVRYAILILLFVIAAFPLKYLIKVYHCNRLYNASAEALSEDTVYFDKNKAIKYNDFSNQFKKYVRKEDFANIVTWYDAYSVFTESDYASHTEKSKYNNYGWRFIISFRDQNKDKPDVLAFSVHYTDTFWGMKIDWIDMSVTQGDGFSVLQ